jgi:hypothetical protein
MLAIFDVAVDLVQSKAITAIRHAEENRGESAAVKNRERERSKFLVESLRCNLELNDLCRLRNKATVRHAFLAVMYLARRHPAFRSMEAFRQKKIVGVMRIIYDYAKVPSYPDTGPQPTVRELFHSDPEDTLNPRYIALILRHYDQVLPGVEF